MNLEGPEESIPRGLKPTSSLASSGTTEVVPFQDGSVVLCLDGNVVPFQNGRVVPYLDGNVVPFQDGSVVLCQGAVHEISSRVDLRKAGALLGILVGICVLLPAQPGKSPPPQLNETGQIQVDGRAMQYVIRRLPVSSFPQLPEGVARALVKRGCLIPQTYQAHRPENVVEGSLERAGSADWAVLCSAKGMVSLLVFFGSAGDGEGGVAQVQVLASAVETERLQAHGGVGGVLGFDWGIDPATPEQVHEAQAGMDKRPARVDHDALADTLVDGHTVYHFYGRGGWVALEMPE